MGIINNIYWWVVRNYHWTFRRKHVFSLTFDNPFWVAGDVLLGPHKGKLLCLGNGKYIVKK